MIGNDLAAPANYSGLDEQQLKSGYEGKAEESSKEDLKWWQNLEFVGFSTMIFVGSDGHQHSGPSSANLKI